MAARGRKNGNIFKKNAPFVTQFNGVHPQEGGLRRIFDTRARNGSVTSRQESPPRRQQKR